MTTSLPLLFNKRHILPSGRIPLRVAPGEQMDTLKYALQQGMDLGVCMEESEPPHSISGIGTRISIEDFNSSGSDGSLMITVTGQSRFSIDTVKKNDAGILVGECHILPSWPEREVGKETEQLAERLHIMFERYPELRSLYQQTQFEDLSWLCQRWLELLPLPTSEKQILMAASSCNETCEYLLSLMKEPH